MRNLNNQGSSFEMMYGRFFSMALAAAIVAAPAYAGFVGVSECDQVVDGENVLGLMTLEADGTRTFHPVGEGGLTDTIVFSEQKALEWVAG